VAQLLIKWALREQLNQRHYAIAFTAFAAASALNLWLQTWCGHEAVAWVCRLAVVLLALFLAGEAILLGTVRTALRWKFLFIPSRYSFHIGTFYDKLMFAMYFVVALTVGRAAATPQRSSMREPTVVCPRRNREQDNLETETLH